MRVLVGAGHPGGANAIIPVVKKLKENGEEVTIVKSTPVVEENYQKSRLKSDVESFEGVKADIILTATATETDTVDQKLMNYANQENIPSIVVLDFWNRYMERFTDVSGNFTLPTKIAVMDNYAKQDMLKLNFSEDVLVVTGQPAFDNLEELARKFSQEERLRVRQKLNSKKYLVPHVFHTDKGLSREEFGFNDGDVVEVVVEALIGLDATYVMRPHPRELKEKPEKFEKFKSLAEQKGIHTVIQGDVTTDEVCLASDIVVGVYSTMLVNCAYMDLDHVSLSPNNKKGNDILITRSLRVTPYADTIDSGVNLLISALTPEDRIHWNNSLSYEGARNYLTETEQNRKNFKTDGKATERVTELVYELTN